LLATTGEVGDTVGDGVDAFGFHDCSCVLAENANYTRGAPLLARGYSQHVVRGTM
jgi:hypothetical protein